MFFLTRYRNSLICDVIPSGTAELPVSTVTPGAAAVKAEVSSVKISHPEYCSAKAYLMTPDLAMGFLDAAQEVPTNKQVFVEKLKNVQ